LEGLRITGKEQTNHRLIDKRFEAETTEILIITIRRNTVIPCYMFFTSWEIIRFLQISLFQNRYGFCVCVYVWMFIKPVPSLSKLHYENHFPRGHFLGQTTRKIFFLRKTRRIKPFIRTYFYYPCRAPSLVLDTHPAHCTWHLLLRNRVYSRWHVNSSPQLKKKTVGFT